MLALSAVLVFPSGLYDFLDFFAVKVVFSKSVLNIRTRLVVTVEPEAKWMPNSDSASKLMPTCKILGQYGLLNYFHSYPYQNSVYLKYNVFFDEVYCNHTEKVYFKYTNQYTWSILQSMWANCMEYTLSTIYFGR